MIRWNWYVHVECNFKVIDTNKFCLVVFNMAAISTMAAMGYTELLFFAAKMAADCQNMILGINDMYWTLRVRIWFHKQSYCSDVFWELIICTELSESEFDCINNQNVPIFAIWLSFYNMTVIYNSKLHIYTIKGLLYIDDLDQKVYIYNVEWIYRIK